MSSWVQVPSGRRPLPLTIGSVLKAYRQSPYPLREDRKEEKDITHSFAEVAEEQRAEMSGNYERSLFSQGVSSQSSSQKDKRLKLFQRFYKQIREESEKHPADCVVLSVNNQNGEYAKSIGHTLQERGLVVEMSCLQAESGLTKALQDIRSDGSHFCILVEQTNVALSSCTVIIFSETLKIHRNMPREQALEFVVLEHGGQERRKLQPEELATRAAELVDDWLEREKQPRCRVPTATRHLLCLMAEGLHLYPEELETLGEYLQTRQEHVHGSSGETDESSPPVMKSIPTSSLSKPPPLLPTPPALMRQELPEEQTDELEPKAPLLPTPGVYPKSKPPPLLSLPHSLLRVPLVPRGAANLVSPLRGLHGAPPTLKSPQQGLLTQPSVLHQSALLPPPGLLGQAGLLPLPGLSLSRPALSKH